MGGVLRRKAVLSPTVQASLEESALTKQVRWRQQRSGPWNRIAAASNDLEQLRYKVVVRKRLHLA